MREAFSNCFTTFLQRCCFFSKDPEYIEDYDETEEEDDVLIPKRTITHIMFCFIVIIISFGVGAYSEESMVAYSGPLLSILGLIIVPIICGIPLSLTIAELSNMLPHEAGYIYWVQKAFGNFWSFQVGSFRLFAGLIDTGLYPAVFIYYNFPNHPWAGFLVQILMILFCVLGNIYGVRIVGLFSIFCVIVAFVPFFLIGIWGIPYMDPHTWILVPNIPFFQFRWGIFLSLILWGFSSIDLMSHFTPQTLKPEKMGFMMIIVIFIGIICTIIPLLTSVSMDQRYFKYTSEQFVKIANELGGPILKFAFEVGSACSSLISIYVFLHIYTNMVAAWASPMFLDIALLRRKGVCKTAWVACLLLGLFSLLPYFFPFELLLQISQTFHQITILLDYASLISLRHEFPDMERPYKIPFGILGISFFIFPAALISFIAIVFSMGSSLSALLTVMLYSLFSVLAYYLWAYIKQTY